MTCASSTIELTVQQLTRLPNAGLYNNNGRQIELFHMK